MTGRNGSNDMTRGQRHATRSRRRSMSRTARNVRSSRRRGRNFWSRASPTRAWTPSRARAGVSKATLYAYFPSKEALFSHLIQVECSEKCAAAAVARSRPRRRAGAARALRRISSRISSPRNGRRLLPDRVERALALSRSLPALFQQRQEESSSISSPPISSEAKAKGLLAFDDADIAAEQLLQSRCLGPARSASRWASSCAARRRLSGSWSRASPCF